VRYSSWHRCFSHWQEKFGVQPRWPTSESECGWQAFSYFQEACGLFIQQQSTRQRKVIAHIVHFFSLCPFHKCMASLQETRTICIYHLCWQDFTTLQTWKGIVIRLKDWGKGGGLCAVSWRHHDAFKVSHLTACHMYPTFPLMPQKWKLHNCKSAECYGKQDWKVSSNLDIWKDGMMCLERFCCSSTLLTPLGFLLRSELEDVAYAQKICDVSVICSSSLRLWQVLHGKCFHSSFMTWVAIKRAQNDPWFVRWKFD
jgi:hypothetical protein